ncbi:MAG: lysylphosphatidylglycerol synthase transmembrane domain-containing protein [Mariprofundaceae bacterium]|nr:lysylphosphatidylglycerol synthase transmembrane domain-containing protein [Mariprofundaceae bacterium]
MLKQLIKITVSASLLGALIYYIDMDAVLLRLRQVDVRWVLLSCLLLFTGQILSAIRWAWLAQGLGLTVLLSRKIRLYFLGMFLSLFLPSIIGGDVARGFLLARNREGAGWQAAASVILERLSGVFAITLLTSAGLLMVDVPSQWLLLWLLAVSGLWTCMLSYRFWHRRLPDSLARWRNLPLDQPQFATAWWKGMALSLCFQCGIVGATIALGHAAGLEMSWPAYTVMVCLVGLASALPISFNGFGVREGGYVGFAVYFGGSGEAAAVMAALWVIVLAIVAAPGAWVLWRMGGTSALRRPETSHTE